MIAVVASSGGVGMPPCVKLSLGLDVLPAKERGVCGAASELIDERPFRLCDVDALCLELTLLRAPY